MVQKLRKKYKFKINTTSSRYYGSYNITRNWRILIRTNFQSLIEMDYSFIKRWHAIINDDKISFIMYTICKYVDFQKETDIFIKAYLELKKNCRPKYLEDLFSFDKNTIISIEKAKGDSPGNVGGFIINCRDPEEELFWNRIPRYESKNNNCLSFKFITQYNLIEKARGNYFLPKIFLEVLKKGPEEIDKEKRKTVLAKKIDNDEEIEKIEIKKEKQFEIKSFFEDSEFLAITEKYTKKCEDLININNKGKKIRDLFCNYILELLILEINILNSQSKPKYSDVFICTYKKKKNNNEIEWYFNWMSIDRILKQFLYKSIKPWQNKNIDDINQGEIYNIITNKSLTDNTINSAKRSFQNRLNENVNLTNVRKSYKKIKFVSFSLTKFYSNENNVFFVKLKIEIFVCDSFNTSLIRDFLNLITSEDILWIMYSVEPVILIHTDSKDKILQETYLKLECKAVKSQLYLNIYVIFDEKRVWTKNLVESFFSTIKNGKILNISNVPKLGGLCFCYVLNNLLLKANKKNQLAEIKIYQHTKYEIPSKYKIKFINESPLFLREYTGSLNFLYILLSMLLDNITNK